MVQGKNSKSYKKKNTSDQNQPHTGFKNLVFGHQFASAGETIIPFNSLVQPTDWPQAGLVNPNAQTLLAAQLQLLKDNITVTSSARGLIQKSEYIVRANQIEFLNIESFANEAFEVEVADLMITGNLIVDMQTIRIEGELADTETDFNMGYEFDVLKEEVIVFRDGIQMFRADNNDNSGATGNYYYLDSGNGRASVIRFFEPAIGVEPVLVATTGGVVDPANVSTFQQIESLQGQLDAVIPTVAALAGVPESNFRSGPNSVDLTQFGNKLIDTYNVLFDAVTTIPTNFLTKLKAVFGKTLIQEKIYTGSSTPTNTSLLEIAFNNVVGGKFYRLNVVYTTTTSAGTDIRLNYFNTDNSLLLPFGQDSSQPATTVIYDSSSVVFLAPQNGSIICQVGSNSGTIATLRASLEELPNHEVTTKWN